MVVCLLSMVVHMSRIQIRVSELYESYSCVYLEFSRRRLLYHHRKSTDNCKRDEVEDEEEERVNSERQIKASPIHIPPKRQGMAVGLRLLFCVATVAVAAAATATGGTEHILRTVNEKIQSRVKETDDFTTTDGPITCYTDIFTGVQICRGIPFATAPVGNNRFRSPQPVIPWTTARSCVLQQPICPQFRLTDSLFLGNEDCLYLDLYIPPNTNHTSANLPVFFWLFGGGWVLGDGYEFGFYDGSNLAAKENMIVVGVNYRLGSLGFMALDGLKTESSTGSTGNYALQDQRAAMQWVQKNIHNFGGDPTKVTIAGESAGAFSTCWHLVSPASKGLFRGAILESGTCDSTQFFVDYELNRSWSASFAASLKCNQTDSSAMVECLRKLPAGDVMTNGPKLTEGAFLPSLYPAMPWSSTIDGSVDGLLDTPYNIIRRGEHQKVPVMMGTNKDEGSIFIFMFPLLFPNVSLPLSEASLNYALRHFFSNNATDAALILDMYPAGDYSNDQDKRAAAILRDHFFACSARRALRAMNEHGTPNTHLYHFEYPGDFIEDLVLGDYHSAELPFVFNNPWPPILHAFSPHDQQMADTINTYWGNFVHSGDPNAGRNNVTVTWPPYVQSAVNGEQNIVLDVPAAVQDNLLKGYCDFWDRLIYND